MFSDSLTHSLSRTFTHSLTRPIPYYVLTPSSRPDITGTAIVNLSLGATRTMILKSKGDYISRLDEGGATVPTKRLYQKISLPHNSVFVLGWQSNRDFLHSIRADKRLAREKTVGELAYNEQRISLTFRTIGTFVDAAGRITGQGARKEVKGGGGGGVGEDTGTRDKHDGEEGSSGTVSGSGTGTEGDDTLLGQSHALLLGFSEENKTSKFDWERRYGPGFDIINFAFVNDNNKGDKEGDDDVNDDNGDKDNNDKDDDGN